MEIYENGTEAQRTVTLSVPLTPNVGTPQVTAVRDGEVVHTFNTVTTVPDVGLSVVVPFSLTRNSANLTINWQFSYMEDGIPFLFNEVSKIEVVTPILTREEIKEIHPHATPSEIDRIEKAVRHVVQAHTGQRFGKFIGTRVVPGAAARKLLMPERLLALVSVNGEPAGARYQVEADGWILSHYPWGVPPVKADFWGMHMHVGGVIHNPNAVHVGLWNERRTYHINGVWGWEDVPSQVKEAAKLLINDYAHSDFTYRDRYLTSMTAADWRIQFNSGAFAKTGNVRADQLLSEFVLKRGWAVL